MSTLTAEQRKHLHRLERWPFRLWCPPSRFNAILAGYEQANARAAAEAAASAEREAQEAEAEALLQKERAYYTVLNKVTTYQGADYRIRLDGQQSWIRAYPGQYDQAATTGTQRSIGVPEPELLQITAA